MSEKFDEAISRLRPLAVRAGATPQERQTLALIYGLKGDQKSALQMARMDLDPAAVEHNLAFYDTLRRLSPDARSRAILSASAASAAILTRPIPSGPDQRRAACGVTIIGIRAATT